MLMPPNRQTFGFSPGLSGPHFAPPMRGNAFPRFQPLVSWHIIDGLLTSTKHSNKILLSEQLNLIRMKSADWTSSKQLDQFRAFGTNLRGGTWFALREAEAPCVAGNW